MLSDFVYYDEVSCPFLTQMLGALCYIQWMLRVHCRGYNTLCFLSRIWLKQSLTSRVLPPAEQPPRPPPRPTEPKISVTISSNLLQIIEIGETVRVNCTGRHIITNVGFQFGPQLGPQRSN